MGIRRIVRSFFGITSCKIFLGIACYIIAGNLLVGNRFREWKSAIREVKESRDTFSSYVTNSERVCGPSKCGVTVFTGKAVSLVPVRFISSRKKSPIHSSEIIKIS